MVVTDGMRFPFSAPFSLGHAPRIARPRPSLASVLLSWLPQPRFCPMGSFATLTRISPGPPKNALQLTANALGSGFLLARVPREKKGRKGEPHHGSKSTHPQWNL